MGSHASPDLWISAEKIQDQQNSEAHFVMLSSAEKNTAEILGTSAVLAGHCSSGLGVKGINGTNGVHNQTAIIEPLIL